MDKVAALRAFVEVAETGGFSSAARRLNMAASSVLRSVDALEESLGAALFNRTTRQVTLSDAGTTYYASTKKLLEDLADADAAVADRGTEPSGPLRVSVPVAFGRRCIATRLATFLSMYPRLELDIRLSDAIVDLVTDQIDVAIRLGEAASSAEVVSKRIGTFSRYVVASREYLEARGHPISPSDLPDHDCLRFAYGAEPQVWTFFRHDEVSKVIVKGRLKTNNSEILREAVLDGAGIALLPDWLVLPDVRSGRLTKLFEDYDVTPNNARSVINALYLPNQRGSRRVNAFIDFVMGILASVT
jgi:DNA-binding transcriptional LysR family regulator